MILTTHALAGAAIGMHLPSSWLVVPASIATHFLLDAIPHGEYVNSKSPDFSLPKAAKKVLLDILLFSSIIAFFIIQEPSVDVRERMILGAFMGAFPDFITFLYLASKRRWFTAARRFHNWCHRYAPEEPIRGWTLKNEIGDLLVSGIAILLLFV